jgi:hypothetical protein
VAALAAAYKEANLNRICPKPFVVVLICSPSGEVSEAKAVVAIAAAYKEAKRVRGYETFQILASAVTFSSHMDAMLSLVRWGLCTAAEASATAGLVC